MSLLELFRLRYIGGFTDNIVLVDKMKVRVNVKLELLESRDFKLKTSKIEYIEWKFSKPKKQDYSAMILDKRKI